MLLPSKLGTASRTYKLCVNMMQAAVPAVTPAILDAFVDCCEKRSLHDTNQALNSIAGNVGILNIVQWQYVVKHAQARFVPVLAEWNFLVNRSRHVSSVGPPIAIHLGAMHIRMLDETNSVPSLDQYFLHSANEEQLRTRICVYVVARWTREVAKEKLKEAIQRRLREMGWFQDLPPAQGAEDYEDDPQRVEVI